LRNQDWADPEIICVCDETCLEYLTDKFERIITCGADFNSESIPVILNRAVSLAKGDVIFFISEFVTFMPNFILTYTDMLYREESTGYVYGSFIEHRNDGEEMVGEVKTDNFDYSESSRIGPVRGIKKGVFDHIGVYNEALEFSYEYDLRLRIFENSSPARVDEPLYSLINETSDPSRFEKMKGFYCYIPSNKSSYSESYLNYSEEEENEFRQTCLSSLQRRGAVLNDRSQPVNCPHIVSHDVKLSVLIPLYNRAYYIGEAIESVLKSGWKDFEIIVIDNVSTDGGLSVVEGYRKRGNVRLLQNDVNTTAGALNIGIREAKGKYVCQIDSDDLYSPGALETLYEYMESNPDSALGVSYYDFIEPDAEKLTEYGVVKHLEYDRNNLIRTDGLGAARIWHRCVLEELGGFDEENLGSYAEDYDLELKLSEKYEVLRIPHVLYHYRINHKKTAEKADYIERHRKKNVCEKSRGSETAKNQ